MLNIPVAFAIGVTCVGYLFVSDISLAILGQRATQGIYSYPFLALPMFVFAGVLMEFGGITRRLMRLANALIGHIAGGLAAVMVLGNALFGTLCGSAIGGTAAVGSIMIPAMKEKKYSASFSASLQGCCGILSSLIPPSLTMVIMGVTGNISIADLLIGGFLPGVIMAAMLGTVAVIISKRRGYGRGERATAGEFGQAFLGALPPMMLPVIILGGIFSGIVTVTEAAVLAVVYAFILAVFVYREIRFVDLPAVCMKVLRIAVPIQLIVAVSAMFAWIVTTEQITQDFVILFTQMTQDPMMFLVLISLFLLILGTFMESNALIIILIPILMPVVAKYNIDPLHFAIIFVTNLCIGAVTPPLGVTLMTAAKIAGIRLSDACRSLMPFLLAMIATLVLVVLVPGISTWLPALMH
ncbi:TRAP transporter large permease [Pusillimonas soli]|uniref:TRAP transporter large permease protein n=2 Tax=Allopusillimonas soli TaxID=659016 RepID=A0A853F9F7_9BURK|nr:TRAP transporter large permease [Allopusillimonas soli]